LPKYTQEKKAKKGKIETLLAEQTHMQKTKELEFTRLGKQRQLVESVNPHTIFENDSQAE